MEKINTIKCIHTILLNKKKVFIATAIAFLVACVLVYSPIGIKPLYKSSAIVYPINLITFGHETATEQLLQFLHSSELESIICKQFNLKNRYHIDTTANGSNDELKKEYQKRIQFLRTNFESIDISVYDTDPQTAQPVLNTLLKQANLIIHDLKLKPVKEYMLAHKNQLDISKQTIDSVNNLLNQLSQQYGFINIKEQSKQLSKKSIGNYTLEEKELFKNITTKGNEYEALKAIVNIELKNYKKINADLSKQQTDLNSKLSYFTVVVQPSLPDSIAFPNRLFIVFLITLSTFILSACTVIILTNLKKQC